MQFLAQLPRMPDGHSVLGLWNGLLPHRHNTEKLHGLQKQLRQLQRYHLHVVQKWLLLIKRYMPISDKFGEPM